MLGFPEKRAFLRGTTVQVHEDSDSVPVFKQRLLLVAGCDAKKRSELPKILVILRASDKMNRRSESEHFFVRQERRNRQYQSIVDAA
jgi:hypothetical protein